MTQRELDALKLLARTERPLLVALNKADRYGEDERERLLERLREHVRGIVRAEDVVAVSARPAPQKRIRVGADGVEHAELVEQPPDIAALRDRLAVIIERKARRWRRSTQAFSRDGSPIRSACASPTSGAISRRK